MTEIEFTEMAKRAVDMFRGMVNVGFDEYLEIDMNVWEGGRHALSDHEARTLASVLARAYPGTHCAVVVADRIAKASR